MDSWFERATAMMRKQTTFGADAWLAAFLFDGVDPAGSSFDTKQWWSRLNDQLGKLKQHTFTVSAHDSLIYGTSSDGMWFCASLQREVFLAEAYPTWPNQLRGPYLAKQVARYFDYAQSLAASLNPEPATTRWRIVYGSMKGRRLYGLNTNDPIGTCEQPNMEDVGRVDAVALESSPANAVHQLLKPLCRAYDVHWTPEMARDWLSD